MEKVKHAKGVTEDTALSADELKDLCEEFKAIIKKNIGKPFPDDPEEQLWGGIKAVFQSWNGKRAISYRRIEGIPHDWGTAVNVQAMVFGNLGEPPRASPTRDPASARTVLRRMARQRPGRRRGGGHPHPLPDQRRHEE